VACEPTPMSKSKFYIAEGSLVYLSSRKQARIGLLEFKSTGENWWLVHQLPY